MTPPDPQVGGANHVDPLLRKGDRGSVWSSDWPVTPWGPAAWPGLLLPSHPHRTTGNKPTADMDS